ncbi:hypothetical protein GQ43DRAFT_425273 [Delitschia confertaspora ATCC 74209]|uniref:SprT-like domain-containing protein n=1 Tax=Delitschia confertaspora ATCC 74209 TaxID=1513339 RepID=A0A9P4MUI1_9PLEO|nr:hypothetical protein GQ43DRAFT_425273 [Delitschia confertaspora ATCC 74209]
MEPSRYRRAYEAMMHVSHMVESRFIQARRESDVVSEASAPRLSPGNQGGNAARDPGTVAAVFLEQDDSDGMEWTPTGSAAAVVPCNPPMTTSKSPLHLLSGETDHGREDGSPRDEKGANEVLLHKLEETMIMDKCVDKLVQDFPDVLNYDDASTFTPSTIEVPRDFGLQMSISINHHLAQVADRKVLEKYRRLLGHRKDPTQKRPLKLGFNPVDLIKKQAVSFSEDSVARRSSLDNEIHPIFRPENFHGCPDEIYEVLKPALRLSTLLILHRATAPFWHTLVFGDRQPDSETSELYGQACYRIRDDVSWSEERETTFKHFLDSQVDTLHFLFHREPLPRDPAYASMGLVADYKNGILRKLAGKCHTSKICLHTDFFTTAKRLSLLQYPEPAMVLRFNLFLASCIVHEMAHFIEVSGPHHERPLEKAEVFFNDNMWTESGIAFELKVFGGRLHPISSRVDCGLGLAILSYPLKELYDKEENILYTIPMDYVSMVQQKETWERDFSTADHTVFHIPRTGSRSAEINGTNLMVWEDEKDADISDHIDGKDTTFHRMDDGQIIKNPQSNNRKPKREPEVRRWSPYGRQRNNTLSLAVCISKEVQEDEKESVAGKEPGNERDQMGGPVDEDMF